MFWLFGFSALGFWLMVDVAGRAGQVVRLPAQQARRLWDDVEALEESEPAASASMAKRCSGRNARAAATR